MGVGDLFSLLILYSACVEKRVVHLLLCSLLTRLSELTWCRVAKSGLQSNTEDSSVKLSSKSCRVLIRVLDFEMHLSPYYSVLR